MGLDFKKKVVSVLIVAVVVAGAFTYFFYNEERVFKSDPNKTAKEEADNLVAKVGKHIVLPEGETPTIATVTDLEKLKNQPFFAKAKVGNKVLIYTSAKKALLYDGENDKIIEVAPINLDGLVPKPKDSKNIEE